MRHFIEVTTWHGEPVLINVDYIVRIESSEEHTKIYLKEKDDMDDCKLDVIEPYERVKHLIIKSQSFIFTDTN